MDAMEQNDYDVFRRDVYRVAVSNEIYEPQHNRRIVRSIGDDNDDDEEDFDDLEALRLAALRSLGTKNSYPKQGVPATDSGSTRRVSLGREDKSDLQIVALERQDSLSSSSTDYEEIDLSERTFADSELANYSNSDVDNPESEDKFQSDSPEIDPEMDTKEDSDEGHSEGVENNDVLTDEDNVENNNVLSDADDVENNDVLSDADDVENNDVLSDADDVENNNVLSDADDVENNDVLSDADDVENNDVLSDADDVENDNVSSEEDDVENVLTDEDDVENNISADEDDVVDNDVSTDEDIEKNSQNNSETLEDELLDSDNEINILNDISITIANESLPPINLDEHLEIVDDEVEDNSELNYGHESDIESDNESLNEHSVSSAQRIIVSRLDSEDENASTIENEARMLEENCASGSEVIVDHKKERKESAVSVTTSSEKVKTKVLPVNKEIPKNILKVEKTTDLNTKPSQIVVKSIGSKLPTAEKPELTITTSKLKKDSSKDILPKEKPRDKAKETRNDKAMVQKRCNENVSGKATNHDSKVKVSSDKEAKASFIEFKSEGENEDKMDFDQLSIEDEDSDFEEEEENQPTVKSKVGLSKIPTERLRNKRSYSRDDNRQRRSRSPERSRASSHSYHSQSLSRDRLRDRRLRDRSRERVNKRRSHSPSTDRTNRGNYSRYQRSRSRDRIQSRVNSSIKSRDRENRHFRSRSRSGSRTRSGRTEKVVESNVDKQIKKASIRGSVKERLEIKKKVNTRPLSRSPRKEIRTRDNGDEEKTVKVKQAKLSTVELIANGTKVVSKSSTKLIKHVGDIIVLKQPKDLRSRLAEKKRNQNEVHTKKESTVSTKPVKEREPDVRIQQKMKQQNVAILTRAKGIQEVHTKQESTMADSTTLDKERELDARIQRIKQQNEAILKRAKEIQAEKMKFNP